MKRLVPPGKLEIITSCGREVALAITDDTRGESWATIKQKLTLAPSITRLSWHRLRNATDSATTISFLQTK